MRPAKNRIPARRKALSEPSTTLRLLCDYLNLTIRPTDKDGEKRPTAWRTRALSFPIHHSDALGDWLEVQQEISAQIGSGSAGSYFAKQAKSLNLARYERLSQDDYNFLASPPTREEKAIWREKLSPKEYKRWCKVHTQFAQLASRKKYTIIREGKQRTFFRHAYFENITIRHRIFSYAMRCWENGEWFRIKKCLGECQRYFIDKTNLRAVTCPRCRAPYKRTQLKVRVASWRARPEISAKRA